MLRYVLPTLVCRVTGCCWHTRYYRCYTVLAVSHVITGCYTVLAESHATTGVTQSWLYHTLLKTATQSWLYHTLLHNPGCITCWHNHVQGYNCPTLLASPRNKKKRVFQLWAAKRHMWANSSSAAGDQQASAAAVIRYQQPSAKRWLISSTTP